MLDKNEPLFSPASRVLKIRKDINVIAFHDNTDDSVIMKKKSVQLEVLVCPGAFMKLRSVDKNNCEYTRGFCLHGSIKIKEEKWTSVGNKNFFTSYLLSRALLANGDCSESYCFESYCPRASLNCPKVDVSRPLHKWTQYYTALGELLSEFEVLRVLSREQKLFGLIKHSENQTKENPTEIGEVVTDEEKQRVGDGRPGSRCVERSSYFRGRDGHNSDQHCRGYCIVAFTTETTEITEIAKGRQKESRVVRNLWDRTKKQRGMSEGKEAPRTSSLIDAAQYSV
ncbi:hypothetical protein WN51_08035 [Melipona quadrifasciata]|uniref:Uncharacterized protein n=1 Tax=Melipona quadrifasciata TaxID=166423 RepID=A0A0M8ZP92_9HYME|nr:hypothetical protein WN51_08035 [Melipona quadrifasciata]